MISTFNPAVNQTDLVNDDSAAENNEILESQWILGGIVFFVVIVFCVLVEFVLCRTSRSKRVQNRDVTESALSEHVEAVSESMPESQHNVHGQDHPDIETV